MGVYKKASRHNIVMTAYRNSLVGVTRLELATSRPPDAYSNQLSYTPLKFGVRDEIRTHTAFRPLPPQSSVSTNSTTRTFVSDRYDAKHRAKNGTRTRDPDLGKVVLYQQSYFRRFIVCDSAGEAEPMCLRRADRYFNVLFLCRGD